MAKTPRSQRGPIKINYHSRQISSRPYRFNKVIASLKILLKVISRYCLTLQLFFSPYVCSTLTEVLQFNFIDISVNYLMSIVVIILYITFSISCSVIFVSIVNEIIFYYTYYLHIYKCNLAKFVNTFLFYFIIIGCNFLLIWKPKIFISVFVCLFLGHESF